jgi:hypothetical protein
MPTATVPASRPASSYEPLALLNLVRAVALAAGSVAEEPMSTREWDRARTLSEAAADAPAARRIAEALGLSWAAVWRLAVMEGHGQVMALGAAQRSRAENEWLTHEYCDFVLRLVARRLGVPTLTPTQYRVERERMLAEQRKGAALRLPTENELRALYPSWDRALAHAGLRARAGRGGQRARVEAADILDVLERCFAHYEAEPTSGELEVFARGNGIPFPRREKPWPQYVAEWKENRRAAGLPVPDGPPPTRERPDYSQDVGAARPGERRRKETWADLDVVVDWVAAYLSQLGGARASQRSYNDWARQQEGAPWSGAFDRHGGWSTVKRAAQDRLRGREVSR